MNSNWNYPTTMWVGKNRVKDLSIACKTLNINKPLLVTDAFFELYERHKQQDISTIEIKRPETPYSDGPPCIELMAQNKIGEGPSQAGMRGGSVLVVVRRGAHAGLDRVRNRNESR